MIQCLPMKFVFAIDSFKGSIDSVSAGKAAAEGARKVFPDAECVVCPLADGGYLCGNGHAGQSCAVLECL